MRNANEQANFECSELSAPSHPLAPRGIPHAPCHTPNARVYLVMTSNCEQYEDYHEYVDSVWSTHDAAQRHIEDNLCMKQVDCRDPECSWSRDRWQVDFPEYPHEEDFADDPDGWADCHDERGELIPYWVESRDAWIVEYPLDAAADD